MNTETAKLTLWHYKWLLFPIVPALFFLGLLVYIYTAPNPNQPDNTLVAPTTVPFNNSGSGQTTFPYSRQQPEYSEPPQFEERPGLVKTQALPNNTTLNTYSSPLTNRPEITITDNKTETLLFERVIAAADYEHSVKEFLAYHGQPDRIITGSNFYGPTVPTYIYARKGVAIIVDPKTQMVLEYHLFSPMSAEVYIQQYGDDIPADKR